MSFMRVDLGLQHTSGKGLAEWEVWKALGQSVLSFFLEFSLWELEPHHIKLQRLLIPFSTLLCQQSSPSIPLRNLALKPSCNNEVKPWPWS